MNSRPPTITEKDFSGSSIIEGITSFLLLQEVYWLLEIYDQIFVSSFVILPESLNHGRVTKD
ncbi:9616_t:CDS:2 [Ambispora gerdemannii]|uniref:9616_t:CDS:1 n=1 Tax=Ambispora gerdemannii TaxID=144530 RepID=A0A9N8YMK7_9GLOM|nr:9616_t:CDS:2 [Ambispora gerdemannii]